MIENKIIESYNQTNDLFGDSDKLNLMNHGYYPICNIIKDDDILLKTSANLYFYLLSKIEDISNKSILDVGCGRGGGISLINKKYSTTKCFGSDNCQKNIEYCLKKYNNINFKLCDALNLQYPKSSFDIILNIESSHCYNSKIKFFEEVYNVLKESGYFLYADIFTSYAEVLKVKDQISTIFFIEHMENISENVYESCNSLKNTIFEEITKNTRSEEVLKYFRAYKYLYELYSQKIQFYKNEKTFFWIFIGKKM